MSVAVWTVPQGLGRPYAYRLRRATGCIDLLPIAVICASLRHVALWPDTRAEVDVQSINQTRT